MLNVNLSENRRHSNTERKNSEYLQIHVIFLDGSRVTWPTIQKLELLYLENKGFWFGIEL